MKKYWFCGRIENMNVTELARQLKTTTSELFTKLPALGFDIGRKAIKVDDRIAYRIMESWRRQERQEREVARLAEIRGGRSVGVDGVELPKKEIKVQNVITVREFASLLGLPVNQVMVELMKNGVLTSINERIDFDTAMIIGENLGFQIVADDNVSQGEASDQSQERLKEILTNNTAENFVSRPPVVVVMGHVDHGKTKILDAIRKTDVVATESGGITQHIGAYQVHKKNKLITFIDTPGHEAFTAMRSRGARVADIAILVIAADDSIQPQTKEAIKIIQDAKLPFVVAINKIDKPDANIERVKKDLADLNLLPEDWGGDVICAPVSAKEGTGIDDLLETILLVAEMNKDTIMADPSRLAIGTIIESHVDKGEGPVATILVQAGILRPGDILSLEGSFCGKVKALKDYIGENVLQVAPGTPAKILGLKLAPGVGSVVEVAGGLEELNKDIKHYKQKQAKDFSTKFSGGNDESGKSKSLNYIIKGDVLGSVEAIIESLAKLETAEIKIKIIGKGLGIITESDILKAEGSKAKIFGFHVKPATNVAELAREKKVTIKYYEVIYHLIEEVKQDMSELKDLEVTRQLIGKAEVIKIFRSESNNMILGARAVDGYLAVCDTVIVERGGEAVGSGKVNRLESARQIVDKVLSGHECGLNFEGKVNIQAGDVLEFYQESK
ncbi:MAG: translation initiation factor IF-2 [bacterium]